MSVCRHRPTSCGAVVASICGAEPDGSQANSCGYDPAIRHDAIASADKGDVGHAPKTRISCRCGNLTGELDWGWVLLAGVQSLSTARNNDAFVTQGEFHHLSPPQLFQGFHNSDNTIFYIQLELALLLPLMQWLDLHLKYRILGNGPERYIQPRLFLFHCIENVMKWNRGQLFFLEDDTAIFAMLLNLLSLEIG